MQRGTQQRRQSNRQQSVGELDEYDHGRGLARIGQRRLVSPTEELAQRQPNSEAHARSQGLNGTLVPGSRARGSKKPIQRWFSSMRWLGPRGQVPKPSGMLRSALRAYMLCAHVRDEPAAGESRTRAWRKQMAPELGGSSGRTRQRKLGGCDFHGRVENRHGRGDQRHSGAEFGEGLGRARASRERGARRRGLGKREAAARAQGGAAELGIRERERAAAAAEEEGGAWARHGWELGEKAASWGKQGTRSEQEGHAAGGERSGSEDGGSLCDDDWIKLLRV
ncbi:uncharacterized protein [Zea mays]|uniref:uncharacterized protein n=1 Tax=Zea mays TaxID=4577 RepID=UPI000220D409|nr:uncharacterized protein LOC103639479 [Zea mays]|eukprot:XP_008660452.1 uncharacterized protein LOC103639479 [Zea mays]